MTQISNNNIIFQNDLILAKADNRYWQRSHARTTHWYTGVSSFNNPNARGWHRCGDKMLSVAKETLNMPACMHCIFTCYSRHVSTKFRTLYPQSQSYVLLVEGDADKIGMLSFEVPCTPHYSCLERKYFLISNWRDISTLCRVQSPCFLAIPRWYTEEASIRLA